MPLKRLVTRGFQNYWRLTRGLRLGVEVCVLDAQNRVLLGRGSHGAIWALPGGPVGRGEAAEQALRRHLATSWLIELDGSPQLVSIRQTQARDPCDHTVVYVARNWHRCKGPAPRDASFEQAFFAGGAMPPDVTPETTTIVKDILRGRSNPQTW